MIVRHISKAIVARSAAICWVCTRPCFSLFFIFHQAASEREWLNRFPAFARGFLATKFRGGTFAALFFCCTSNFTDVAIYSYQINTCTGCQFNEYYYISTSSFTHCSTQLHKTFYARVLRAFCTVIHLSVIFAVNQLANDAGLRASYTVVIL